MINIENYQEDFNGKTYIPLNIAKKAIKVAADICVFTNDNVKIEKI